MDETVNEKVLDKLRKLMAHRDSAASIGSQQEAEAFASRVQELLNKYKLEEHEIRAKGEKPKEDVPIDSTYIRFSEFDLLTVNKRILWTENLGGVVARNYFCRVVVIPGSNSLYFAGQAHDREVAVFVFVTLVRAATKMCEMLHKKKELVRHLLDEPIDMRNFRESFYLGFNEGIRERLDSARKEAEKNPTFGLILYDSAKALEKWLDKHTRTGGGGPSAGRLNATAHAAGKEYGKSVPIQTGVKTRKQGSIS